VRRLLGMLTRGGRRVVLFIDEFDRPRDDTARALFADTIKILSDHGIDSTLVLIGVGSDVGDLIAEHASIGRSLVQVQMAPMGPDEVRSIIATGMKKAELTVDDGFVEKLVEISQGLPHYAHLVAQHAARYAVEEAQRQVTVADLQPAVRLAVEDVSQLVRELYIKATSSNRATLYDKVLLACALAKKNEIGEFGSADVREPMRKITGRDYEINAFVSHLNDFSGDGPRGGILRKRTAQGRFIFRFENPLFTPYVLMKGVSAGLI